MWPILHRRVRILFESQVSPLLQLEAKSELGSSGCFLPELDRAWAICASPFMFGELVYIQNDQQRRFARSGSQSLSLTTLVCLITDPLLRGAPPACSFSTLPLNQNKEQHPVLMGGNFQFAAWKLTSAVSTVRRFRNRLRSSLRPPDGQALGALATRAGKHRVRDALQGLLIPFRQLQRRSLTSSHTFSTGP